MTSRLFAATASLLLLSGFAHSAEIKVLSTQATVQRYTVFASGIIAGAKESDAAKALVKLLTAPAAAQAFKKQGMEPG